MASPLHFREESASDGQVLQPQCVLPEQFFRSFRRQQASQTGEYRLLVAVLEEAIRCFQQNAFRTGTRQRRLFLEAEQWFMGNDHRSAHEAGFSFGYVCEVLSLDSTWLRAGIHRWRESLLKPPQIESGRRCSTFRRISWWRRQGRAAFGPRIVNSLLDCHDSGCPATSVPQLAAASAA